MDVFTRYPQVRAMTALKDQTTQELQGRLNEVRARVAKAQEEGATGDSQRPYDGSKVTVYGDDVAKAENPGQRFAEKVRADNAEMNALQGEIESRRELGDIFSGLEQPRGTGITHPGGDPEKEGPLGEQRGKTFREALGAVPGLKGDDGRANLKALMDKQGSVTLEGVSLKTLFETGAGWAPESIRSGMVVPAATRPIQILDILPMGTIGQEADKYMEETTRTHAAAERAEGAAYAEAQFVLTEQTKAVRSIGTSIPVTDEQLEDVANAASYLEDRLRFGIRQRMDSQVLNGDDISPNLAGILNHSNLQTQAKGSDPTPDAFYKAMTRLRLTGRVNPTHHLVHFNDWQDIRLLRTVDGVYIWGNPSESGPERMFGLPVVVNDAISEGTGLVGAFEAAWVQLKERRGIVLERGFVGTQFTEGKQTLRAGARVVLSIYRGSAFCEVTGI